MEDLKDLPQEEQDLSAEEEPVDSYQEQLKDLEEEVGIYRDLAGRAQAELVNYRARMEREMKRVRELAGERSALEMIPVLDNLDRALDFKEGYDLSSVVEGVRMVRRQFMSSLEILGVKAVSSIGEAFSPEFHEAIGVVEVDDPSKDGLVVDEFQRGYTLSDRLIRPAKVRVGTYSGE